MDPKKEVINSIDRALDILLAMQQEGKELGITQISNRLGMHKSTVHRTLDTLERKGFVQQNPDNGKYWLGLQFYSLGMLVREKMPLARIIYPYAKALAEKFKEGVHISVLDISAHEYPKHVLIEKVTSQQVLSLTPPVGSSAPCHCSAVGKCLLAYCDGEYLGRFLGKPLPAFTLKTIVDWNLLLKELELIKNRGYSLDDEELELGLSCIASPIFDSSGKNVAALSLSGPTSRLKSDNFGEIVTEVQNTTKIVSALL